VSVTAPLRLKVWLAFATCLSSFAIAQVPEDPRLTADPTLFVARALQDGMTEIEVGRLAERRAQAADLKSFGARVVKDHTQANDALAALATAKGIKVPTELDREHRTMIASLNDRTAAEFDAAFAQRMVADHGKAITLFTQATQERDPDLAALARQTLPMLKAHKLAADALALRFPAAENASRHSTSEH
jgi:putative membrane protein